MSAALSLRPGTELRADVGHKEVLSSLRNTILAQSPTNLAVLWFNRRIMEQLGDMPPKDVPRDPIECQRAAIAVVDAFGRKFQQFIADGSRSETGLSHSHLLRVVAQLECIRSAVRDLNQHEIAVGAPSRICTKPIHTKDGSFRVVEVEGGFGVFHLQGGRFLGESKLLFAGQPDVSVLSKGSAIAIGQSPQEKLRGLWLRAEGGDPFDTPDLTEKLWRILPGVTMLRGNDRNFFVSGWNRDRQRVHAVVTLNEKSGLSVKFLDSSVHWTPSLPASHADGDLKSKREATWLTALGMARGPQQLLFPSYQHEALVPVTLPEGYRLTTEGYQVWNKAVLFRAVGANGEGAFFRQPHNGELKMFSEATVWTGKSQERRAVDYRSFNFGGADVQVAVAYKDSKGHPRTALGRIYCTFKSGSFEVQKPLPSGSRVVSVSDGRIIGVSSGKGPIKIFTAHGTCKDVEHSKGWTLVDYVVTNSKQQTFHPIVFCKSEPRQYAILNLDDGSIVKHDGKILTTLRPIRGHYKGPVIVHGAIDDRQMLFSLNGLDSKLLLTGPNVSKPYLKIEQYDFSPEFFLAGEGDGLWSLISASTGKITNFRAEGRQEEVSIVRGTGDQRCWIERRSASRCELLSFALPGGPPPTSADLSSSEITRVRHVFAHSNGTEIAVVERKGLNGAYLFNLKTREFLNDQPYSYAPESTESMLDSEGRILITINRHQSGDSSRVHSVTVVVRPTSL